MNEISPHMIYCSLTGYGSSGPYHKRPGYDVIAASVGGLLSVTGSENGDPCKVGVAMTDIATGLYAHGAILAAMLERNKTGKGQHIECNLLSTQVACMINLASTYLNGNQDSKRWGTAHASIVPYQSFSTKDGYITIGAGNNEQFAALCERLDLNHLIDNNDYKSNALRVINRIRLISILSDTFKKRNTSDWLKIFEGVRFPYGPINKLSEVFSDPQVIHNEMVQTIQHSSSGDIRLVSPPVRYSQSENYIRLPPPVLGEHTKKILKGLLGYSDDNICDLVNDRIIQCG